MAAVQKTRIATDKNAALEASAAVWCWDRVCGVCTVCASAAAAYTAAINVTRRIVLAAERGCAFLIRARHMFKKNKKKGGGGVC